MLVFDRQTVENACKEIKLKIYERRQKEKSELTGWQQLNHIEIVEEAIERFCPQNNQVILSLTEAKYCGLLPSQVKDTLID